MTPRQATPKFPPSQDYSIGFTDNELGSRQLHESKRVLLAARRGQNGCKISPGSPFSVMSSAFYKLLKSRHKKRSGRYHFVLVTTAPIIGPAGFEPATKGL